MSEEQLQGTPALLASLERGIGLKVGLLECMIRLN